MNIITKISLLTSICMALALATTSRAYAESADLSQVMIDVSSHNNLPNILPHLSERKIELVVVRATIGRGTPDTSFNEKIMVLRAQSPDTLKGAYHALYPTSSGKEQARDFLQTLKKSCLPGEKYILAVDWEKPKLRKITLEAANTDIVEDFVREVEADTGKRPMIYTGPDIIVAHRQTIGALTAASPLWLSTYYSKLYLARGCNKQTAIQNGFTCMNSIHGLIFPDEADYAPWDAWTFWQFSSADKGDPSYIRKKITNKLPVDVSFYGGGRDDFHKIFIDKYSVRCEEITV